MGLPWISRTKLLNNVDGTCRFVFPFFVGETEVNFCVWIDYHVPCVSKAVLYLGNAATRKRPAAVLACVPESVLSAFITRRDIKMR